MSKQVYIHAGCHRAGSSSFQLCLALNRGHLDDLGYDLAYPGRDGAPGGRLRLKLPSPRESAAKRDIKAAWCRTHLTSLSPDPDRALILSEENIPGRMFHFYKGYFFPSADLRLTMLRAALGVAPEHVLFVIRDYSQLFVSSFRKRAEAKKVPPFRNIAPNMLAMARGWPEVIADIQQGLQPERLTVVEYDRRGESRSLLSRLVPDLYDSLLKEPARVVNRSATDAGLAAVQARLAAGRPLRPRKQKALIAGNAADRSDCGFARFTASETEILADRYHRDLDRLAVMPGVHLIA